ncbi:hypothetical protein NQZ68_022305, partial [Dissostichus eleginoides]
MGEREREMGVYRGRPSITQAVQDQSHGSGQSGRQECNPGQNQRAAGNVPKAKSETETKIRSEE